MSRRWLCCTVIAGAIIASSPARGTEFRGRVVDAETGAALAARVYLYSDNGESLFVESDDPAGSALPYREQWVPMPNSVELHTTVSAHPFRIDLEPGEYTLEIERGKEYLPLRERLSVSRESLERIFRLKRWVDMSARGWYSGETHVHRRLVELPNVMLAEDLNVAFPVTFWTIRSDAAPDLLPSPLRRQGPSPFGPREDRGTEPVWIDPTHLYFPRNTEYEIFSVDGRPHVLGAIFLLNHRSIFSDMAPPIGQIAARAHAEGAVLDLDKHSWPWSMMLVPVAPVDLFELSNNSVWRTQFGFNQAPASLPEWLNLERDGPQSLTEWGWLNYGWQIYYALLNCGFPLAPTAGTASGVHPVPLGHSRVYVQTGDSLTADRWLAGLKAGRSFVTTGPMLLATVNGKLPGERLEFATADPQTVTVEVESLSEHPISAIEILVNGQVAERISTGSQRTESGAWQVRSRRQVKISNSSWIAVRSVEPRADDRKRFAHTAPWYVMLAGQPITPRRAELEYFIELMNAELKRNQDVLKPEALAEFRQALAIYRALLARAR